MTIKHLYPVIEPSLNLDFANSKKLDPRITFTRGSIGTYVGDDGLIKTAAQHEARFDHDSDGNSLGLLVEESRTNLLISSEDLSGYSIKSVTVTFDSSVVNPTGLTGSYKILANSGLSNQGIRILKPATSANNIVVSAFVKKSTYRYVYIGFGGTGNSFTALFDIEPGLTSNRLLGQGGNGTYTNIDAGYQNFPNDWIRIWAVGTTTGTDGATVGMSPNATTFNITNWTTAGTEEIYVWGLQYEDNVSFPTSYIPTEGSTVTRAADVASISGDNFGTFRTNLLKYSEEFDQASWAKTNTTITPNDAIAPNGTQTAERLQATTASTARTYQDVSVTPGATYVASIYAKAGTSTNIIFREDSEDSYIVLVDLLTGAVTGGVGGTGFSIPVGNGWYRVGYVGSVTGSNFRPEVRTSSTDYIYVWGAQLEEGSTATDYIKSDVNWTSRASSATYYDANGTLKKSSYNLLTYSEDFTNSVWPTSSRATLLTATGVDDPFGGTTASTWKNGGTLSLELIHRVITVTAGIPYTYSVWLRRRSGTGTIEMYVGDNIAFDVTSQVTTEWKRISVTNTPSTTTGRAYIAILGIGDEIDVWGAQVETGTYAGDYAKTEGSAASTPRTAAYLPDGSGNFVSAGPLLLEDAGTNLLLQSEDFSTTWSRVNVLAFGSGSIVNDAVAPDGSTTADKITPDTSTNQHRLDQTPSSTAGAQVFTVYAKAAGYSFVGLRIGLNGAGFDLLAGTVSSIVTSTSASIAPVGDGWYRCSVYESSAAANATTRINVTEDGSISTSFAGDGTSGIYLWGAQLEESSYATSYIPTTSSTATRAADVSTSATASVFESDWYRQDEGTVFQSLNAESSYTSGLHMVTAKLAQATDLVNTGIGLQFGTTYGMSGQMRDGTNLAIATLPYSNSKGSAVLAYNQNYGEIAASWNGDTTVVDTNALYTSQSLAQLLIGAGIRISGSFSSIQNYNGTIRRLTYWPQRLPNATLQALTL